MHLLAVNTSPMMTKPNTSDFVYSGKHKPPLLVENTSVFSVALRSGRRYLGEKIQVRNISLPLKRDTHKVTKKNTA